MNRIAMIFWLLISLPAACGYGEDVREPSSYLTAMFAQLQSIEKFDVIAKGESLIQSESGGLGTLTETFRWRRDLASNVDEFFRCKVLDFEKGEKKVSTTKYSAMASGPKGVLVHDFPQKPYLIAESIGPEKFLRCSNAFDWRAIGIIPFPPSYVPENLLTQMMARCTVPSEKLKCSVEADSVRIVSEGSGGSRYVWVLDHVDYLPKRVIAENSSNSRTLNDNRQVLRQDFGWREIGNYQVPISINGELQRKYQELDDDDLFAVTYDWKLKWLTIGEDLEPTNQNPSAVIQELAKVKEMLDFDSLETAATVD